MSGMPPIRDEEEAKAIMAGGLGKTELEFVMSITAPLFWVIKQGEREFKARNGSVFFLDAGEGLFAVTANHVIQGWRDDCRSGQVVALQVGDLPIDLDGTHAVIASHSAMDIATFRISKEDVKSIGKTVLTGFQKNWPPRPPDRDKGVYFGGFPGIATLWLAPKEISFGAAPGGVVATSVSEIDISSQIDRRDLVAVLGAGIPPENYDFRGISGGPMLTVVEQNGLRSWSLAGVIYQGPNPSEDESEAIAGLEIIKARRSHFILPNGMLDARRWAGLNMR